MSFQESSGQPIGQTVEVIGIGRRFVAYFIDSILLVAIQFGLFFCIGLLIGVAGGEEAIDSFSLVINCLSLIISAAYFIAFWATTAQTPGKMAMGIKVISEDGSPVSWGKAALRFLGYIISSLVLSIGFIWAAFDAKRQGWHDKIAKTYVVYKDTNFSSMDNVAFVPSDEGSSTGIILVILFFVLIVMVPIVIIAILLILGPVVGNVFSNIVENLGTPTP